MADRQKQRARTELGERIREARRELGLTQAAFAERIGAPMGLLDRFEHGTADVARYLDAIADATGKTVDWFRAGESREAAAEELVARASELQKRAQDLERREADLNRRRSAPAQRTPARKRPNGGSQARADATAAADLVELVGSLQTSLAAEREELEAKRRDLGHMVP